MTEIPDHLVPDKPIWRMPVGMFAILVTILIWCGIVVSLFDWIGDLNFWLQLPIYVVAGIAWIFPIKPIMVWMSSGKFRHPPETEISETENGASDET